MTKVDSHVWTYDELGDGSAEITYFLQGYLNAFLTTIGAWRVYACVPLTMPHLSDLHTSLREM